MEPSSTSRWLAGTVAALGYPVLTVLCNWIYIGQGGERAYYWISIVISPLLSGVLHGFLLRTEPLTRARVVVYVLTGLLMGVLSMTGIILLLKHYGEHYEWPAVLLRTVLLGTPLFIASTLFIGFLSNLLGALQGRWGSLNKEVWVAIVGLIGVIVTVLGQILVGALGN